MGLDISYEACLENRGNNDSNKGIDSARVSFIVSRRIRGMAGRRRLGALWLILHPIALSLVYLFVFTVIRSSPNSINLFIGISMFNIFSSSFRSGVNSVSDFSGGIKAERVRTWVISMAMFRYRAIDVLLQSIGVSLILLLGLSVSPTGVLLFVFLSLVMGILAEGLALNLSLLVRRIPDTSNLIDYGLLVVFFGSPVLYPLSLTSGIHYQINSLNPLSFFLEAVRYYSGTEDVILSLINAYSISILAMLVILSIRGYLTLDRLRWEVSNWS